MLPVARSSWVRAGVSPLANATSELPLSLVRARPGFAASSAQAEDRMARAGRQPIAGHDPSGRLSSVGRLPPPRRSATISRADAIARGGTVGLAKWRGASDRVERARLRGLARSPAMSGSALADPKDFYRAPNLTRFGQQGSMTSGIIGPKGPFRPGLPGQPPRPGYLGPPTVKRELLPPPAPQPVERVPQYGGPSGSPGGGGGGPGAPVSLRLGVGGGGGGGGSLALAATGTGEPAPSSTLYLLVAAGVALLVLWPRLRGAA